MHCLPSMLPCSQSTRTQSYPALARVRDMLLPGSNCHTPNASPPLSRTDLTRFVPCIVRCFDEEMRMSKFRIYVDEEIPISDLRLVTSREASLGSSPMENTSHPTSHYITTPRIPESVNPTSAVPGKTRMNSRPYIICNPPLKMSPLNIVSHPTLWCAPPKSPARAAHAAMTPLSPSPST